MCRQVYRREFSDGTDERLDELYDQLDSQHTNHVDFLTWSERVGALHSHGAWVC